MSITIQQRCKDLEELHGGSNAAADFLKIDRGYWSCLRSGKKSNPQTTTLNKLFLEKVVTYFEKGTNQ